MIETKLENNLSSFIFNTEKKNIALVKQAWNAGMRKTLSYFYTRQDEDNKAVDMKNQMLSFIVSVSHMTLGWT